MNIPVEYIAHLARLHLSEAEKERLEAQLDGILRYVEKLGELETGSVEPTSHVLSLSNVMRDDELRDSLHRESALANAPDKTKDFYRVPRIIE